MIYAFKVVMWVDMTNGFRQEKLIFDCNYNGNLLENIEKSIYIHIKVLQYVDNNTNFYRNTNYKFI